MIYIIFFDHYLPFFVLAAANKEELLEMITHGAEKIINSSEEYIFFSPLFPFC